MKWHSFSKAWSQAQAPGKDVRAVSGPKRSCKRAMSDMPLQRHRQRSIPERLRKFRAASAERRFGGNSACASLSRSAANHLHPRLCRPHQLSGKCS